MNRAYGDSQSDMDVAADYALIDLMNEFEEMSEEEARGARLVLRWFTKHYMEAGYTRLGKLIKELPEQFR